MPLRLAVFDFDQTLTIVHLYNAIAGDESSWRLPSPYATTEHGQLARIAELEATPEFRQQGGLALAAFGGAERVAQLQGLLQQLTGAGVECIICSRGLVGPVRKCLDQLGMLRYFSKVYANVGGSVYGSTAYDRQLPPTALGADSRYLGSPELADWRNNKQVLVSRCLRERGLLGSEAVFVDDHPSEIENLRSICHTVQVQSQRGMGQREIELLRSLLAGPLPGASAAQLPAAADAEWSRDRAAVGSPPTSRERSSLGGGEAQQAAALGGGGPQRQASRPASLPSLPAVGAGPPPRGAATELYNGWLPTEVSQVPGSGCLQPQQPPQQQQQQAPTAASFQPQQQQQQRRSGPQQASQAGPSFVLVPPLPLQQTLPGAPGASPSHPGYRMPQPAHGQQYLSAQSFVHLPSLDPPGGHQRHDSRGPRNVRELRDGSFTDSEDCAPSVSNFEKRKSPWCCSQ